jgi:hypothetical protein
MDNVKKQIVVIVDIADTNRYSRTGEIETPASANNSATQFLKLDDILVGMYRSNVSNLDYPTTPKKLGDTKYFANFNYGYCDVSGIVQGLRSIAEDATQTVTFVSADHPNKGGLVYDMITVGIGVYEFEEKYLSAKWRICNEKNDPLGAGSEGLIHGSDESLEAAAAAVAIRLKRPNCFIFRQPNKKKYASN